MPHPGSSRFALTMPSRQLQFEKVPTICLDHLSDAQKRAYIIADNRLAELAEWDDELLALELQGLCDIDFDVSLTGFEVPEVDLIIESLHQGHDDDAANQIPALRLDEPAVSRTGDLWIMDGHRLLCGDALDPVDYDTLLGPRRAQMVFTDPPYNVPIDGHVSGKGKVCHREFVMASGEMTADEFAEFLSRCIQNMADVSKDGSVHFVCMDWRHLHVLQDAARQTYSEMLNLCVWNKTNGGMGSLYRSKHELVGVFKNGTAPHINNVQLGKFSRNRTNVWDYAGVNTFGPDRHEELALHPTVKPVAMVVDAIKDCSKRNGIILDPFIGSGTTIIAAERAGRRCYAMELDPKYVDQAIRRWQKFTGHKAVLERTGQSFDEIIEHNDTKPGSPCVRSNPKKSDGEGRNGR